MNPLEQTRSEQDKECIRCGKLLVKNSKHRTVFLYCGSKIDKTGCAWENRQELVRRSFVKNRDSIPPRSGYNGDWKKRPNNHPDRVQARVTVRLALDKGTLIKPSECSMKDVSVRCGGKIQAHHSDYSKPLDVLWVCHRHHRAVHYPKHYGLLTTSPSR